MHPLQQKENPRRHAGLISQLLFIWLVPLIQKGFRRTLKHKTLELSDLYRVLPSDESRILGDQLEIAWNRELAKSAISKQFSTKEYRPSLRKALLSVFGSSYAAYGVFPFYEECIVKISQPLILGILLQTFSRPDDFPPYAGPLLGMVLVLLSILYTSSDHPFTFAVQHLGMKIRISICALIYRKALRMSRRALEEMTTSHVISFLSSDMSRFDVLMTYLHYIWVAPIQFSIILAVLYKYLNIGWPCFSGIGLLLLFVPFQGMMGRIYSRLRQETVDKTDKRLLLMEELLSAMRVIKMYAWETIFVDSINEARVGEISGIRKTMNWKALNQSIFFVTSRFTLFLTLLGYVLLGNQLSPELVYVALALYYSVESVLTLFFPTAVISLAESSVAISRFEHFLLLQEKPLLPGCYDDESPIPNLDDPEIFQQPQSTAEIVYKKPSRNKRSGQEGDVDDDDEDSDSVDTISTVSNNYSNKFPKSKSKLEGSEKVPVIIEEKLAPEIGNRFTEGNPQPAQKNASVIVRNVCGQWDPLSRDMAFNNVSCKIKRGEILAVIGPVGSGKSSLVQAILGELPISSGELSVKGSVAYSSQNPWIFPGTVRDNILFGLEFDSHWYDQVVEACALSLDLRLLPYGDHTLVGDKGSSLSGGQKARISMARAVYSDADVFVFDDPLSAVDAEVGQTLVNDCILELLKDKVRILVTHQLQYLPYMTRILLLVDGWPKFYGDFKCLTNSEIPFTEVLTRIQSKNAPSTPSLLVPDTSLASSDFMKGSELNTISPSSPISGSDLIILDNIKNPLPPPVYEEVYEGTKSQPISISMIPATAKFVPKQPPIPEPLNPDQEDPTQVDEELGSGDINWRLYWSYYSSGSTCCAIIVVIVALISCQAVFICSEFALQFWIQAEGTNKSSIPKTGTTLQQKLTKDRNAEIVIYAALMVLLFILSLVRALDYYRICVQTSVDLYQRMLSGVMRSPMSFFEKNSLGRILNRFSRDMSITDELLPTVSLDTIEIFLQFLGVIIVISIGSPIMLIPAAIMACSFYFLRKFYFSTARALKRLESVARSPVFSHISITLDGLPTIRAFGVQAMFQKQFESYLDIHSSVWYLLLASTRWLAIVVDWLSILFVAAVVVNCLVNNPGDSVSGLSLTTALMLTTMMQWGIRQSTELSNQLISVERILEFCDLKPEAPIDSQPEDRPPKTWPEKGEIRIQNLSLRYGDISPVTVLKNINCIIYAGEKVGVVGRTGAGKSSLLSVIFRIVEATEGFIEIDGIMTNGIGLHDLRSKLSIIPQEPVLFIGNIRTNLDPFHIYTDSQVWAALKDVNLKEVVTELPNGIYSPIAEGGTNFSSGQKQLIALARVILRSNQIIVLDEATANVDPETDSLIQKTLRTNFAQCTVITIAHRLHTVMDSDRIIVMDAGRILEMDEPNVLLTNRSSALYQLAQQTGKAEAENLLHIAKLAAASRRKAETTSK